MKNYKIQIEDTEVQFFRHLMDKLGFTKYEEIKPVNEPRVYPGGNFEIRSSNNPAPKSDTNLSAGNSSLGKQQSSNTRKDAMKDIRDIISRIDRERNKNK
ncbi:hypothetical protein SAMN06265379_10693 [Saccharicrinis carchari]|uniref:Uncharacterized protein n=1 Tax=Saccharicrinis carchari TaxID=1168039 RepID=A0A521DRK7_SACCC|nr:hypothetical protein [Saccharicrinis carchari]SMO74258.1 hypothetical protein SAMN06265379_10693 [Saccharicrinis carchari]